MISSDQIAKNYEAAGIRKASLPAAKLLLLGFFAGMFIALAGAAAAIASAAVENASAARIVSALVFPAGLVMVVLTGSELFTGNSLMVLSLLDRKITAGGLLRNYLFVYLGNLLGSLFVALLVVYSHIPGLYDGGLAQNLVNTAAAKVNLSLSDAFLRAILCNVLVCIAVWLTMSTEQAGEKVLALYPPIAVFVLCGFEHCVANMFYIPAGLMVQAEYGLTADRLTWSGFLLHNLLPVTLGNLVGGMLVVGCSCWFLYLRGNQK